MAELKCPHCGKTFKVDDTSYADILSQVRNQEFDAELRARLRDAAKQADANRDLALARQEATQAKRLSELEAKLKQVEVEKELAITKALAPVEKELESAKYDLKTRDSEAKLRENALKMQYEGALKLKDEEIDRLKDLKTKLSTKMVGETLEQHCQTEFNRLRATAFRNAYFEKDNDARTGSKGDYIYRETDEQGNEIISIMFEMKNENETTATKHKNEDFLKELDKDRREKNCEYAVLVSLLEEIRRPIMPAMLVVSIK
jgi:hypothetical protein